MKDKIIAHPEPALSPLNEPQHVLELLEKWQAEPYDGLKGTLPHWVPDQIVVDFAVDQYAVCLAVKNKRLTIYEAYSCLKLSIKREELSRLKDELFEQHRNDEVLDLNERIGNLIFPEPLKLHGEFSRLARTHVDLKLEQKECLKLWLGNDIAGNNLLGKAQREGGAKGGTKGGEIRRNSLVRRTIVDIARSLINDGHPRYGLAPKIQRDGDFHFSVRQINNILREAGI